MAKVFTPRPPLTDFGQQTDCVMPMQETTTTDKGAMVESHADRVRAEQSASFQAEDFERFFACARCLAEICPEYAGSYEFHVHGVLHALARIEPDPFFL